MQHLITYLITKDTCIKYLHNIVVSQLTCSLRATVQPLTIVLFTYFLSADIVHRKPEQAIHVQSLKGQVKNG